MDTDKFNLQLIGHFKEIVALNDQEVQSIIAKLEIKKVNRKD